MKSLERQLQLHLALILIVVMGGIWLIGSQFPRNNSHDYATATSPTQTLQQHHDSKLFNSTYKPPRRFNWLFPILASIGILCVLLVQGFIIRRTFRQLDSIRHEVEQLETGEINKLSEHVPSEIYPIVHEFNHVLSLMEERLERSRHSLGNLAHALKGPINLLMQTLDQPDSNISQDKDVAKQQVQRIHQLTERELKRARMAGLGNTTQRFDPHEDLPTLIEVLAQVHHQSNDCIQLTISPDTGRFADREDMLELLGNLLDNACKYANNTVKCHIQAQQSQIQMIIEDDGKGRTNKELQQMTERGTRLDESIEGHGLGLSICKDIVKLYGGNLQFSRSTLGGLRVEVLL